MSAAELGKPGVTVVASARIAGSMAHFDMCAQANLRPRAVPAACARA